MASLAGRGLLLPVGVLLFWLVGASSGRHGYPLVGRWPPILAGRCLLWLTGGLLWLTGGLLWPTGAFDSGR